MRSLNGHALQRWQVLLSVVGPRGHDRGWWASWRGGCRHRGQGGVGRVGAVLSEERRLFDMVYAVSVSRSSESGA